MQYEALNLSVELQKDGLLLLTKTGREWKKVSFTKIVSTSITEPNMLTPGIWELTPSFGNKVEIHFSKSHVAGIRELDARVRDLIRRVRPEDRAVAPGTNVIATTGIHVPGRPILSIVDVVSAEVAMGINTFKDIATAFRDVVGGRAKSLQGVMREARQLCIQELKAEAERVGGEAVIGVDLDYTEIRSGMMLVVATGTAVTLSPVEDLPARSG